MTPQNGEETGEVSGEAAFRMHAERTPNPNSLKWVLGAPIAPAGTAASFDAQPERDVSPLAAALFAIDGVRGVFIAADFVTVSKSEAVEWLDIAQPTVDAIRALRESGESALGGRYESPPLASNDELAAQICRVIDEQIRPAIARDGGDIVFVGVREGVVEVQLRGACRGCPSATLTLKSAVETRLKEAIPQIQRVVTGVHGRDIG